MFSHSKLLLTAADRFARMLGHFEPEKLSYLERLPHCTLPKDAPDTRSIIQTRSDNTLLPLPCDHPQNDPLGAAANAVEAEAPVDGRDTENEPTQRIPETPH